MKTEKEIKQGLKEMETRKKSYLKAKKLVADYERQLEQAHVIGMFKISFADIETCWNGFSVQKITKMTDRQLMELQDKLFEIDICNYTNIEEYKYLTVGWLRKYIMTDKEVNKIVEILNCL